MIDWLNYFETWAKQSGINNWMFAVAFQFFFLFLLYGFARLLSMLIVKWMPDGKIRRFLLQKAPEG